MTRRKSERTTRQNERDCPYIVELKVSPNGFGAKLDLIHEFHRGRGLEARSGRGQRRDDQEFVRWCFVDRGDAEAFKTSFGGQLIPSGQPIAPVYAKNQPRAKHNSDGIRRVVCSGAGPDRRLQYG
jgi:hypothetical protein